MLYYIHLLPLAHADVLKFHHYSKYANTLMSL